jgi:thiol-disulfide isomerase/thioredoxin
MAVRAPKFGIDFSKNSFTLVDFFTFSCVNCSNNIRHLNYLYQNYHDISIVGIHTPKFDYEHEDDALEKACENLKIEYKVIQNSSHKIAKEYAIKAWPTLVLVNTKGYIVDTFIGEKDFSKLVLFLENNCKKRVTTLSQNNSKNGNKKLHYPQKIVTLDDSIVVSNSGNNELVTFTYEGDILKRYKEFDAPMGMAYHDKLLYVCEFDKVSLFNFENDTKETLFNNLRNPTDIEIIDNKLYISLAGSHEVVGYNLDTKEKFTRFGNTFEALRDGPLDSSQLAQPSSLTSLPNQIWFVDAESSSLRYIENSEVKTVIGEGLFEFGDSCTGTLKLQHPQALVAGKMGDGCGGGRLFIADTFNNKIKVYDPFSHSIMDLIEGLDAPMGIAKRGCILYIVNTNAHEIITFNLSEMKKAIF